jgi:SagB-type dehydrogenase family enzyme
MKRRLAIVILAVLASGLPAIAGQSHPKESRDDMTLKMALQNRKTTREFTGDSLPRPLIDEILWAAYGITHERDGIQMRTAPSAGATYPVGLLCAVRNVESLPDGLYRLYSQSLEPIEKGNLADRIGDAVYGQDFVAKSNLIAFMVYHPEKIEPKYGDRARDFALLECGHIGQNMLLMASAQGLGSVPKGAFDKEKLAAALELKPGDEVLYMICVGTIKKDNP